MCVCVCVGITADLCWLLISFLLFVRSLFSFRFHLRASTHQFCYASISFRFILRSFYLYKFEEISVSHQLFLSALSCVVGRKHQNIVFLFRSHSLTSLSFFRFVWFLCVCECLHRLRVSLMTQRRRKRMMEIRTQLDWTPMFDAALVLNEH